MKTIEEFVRDQAARLVTSASIRPGGKLDYGLDSAQIVEEMLAEAVNHVSANDEAERRAIVELFGCYLLEMARRKFGGRYVHSHDYDAPVLVVGTKDRHVALVTYLKVNGRLSGDEADNIPFFLSGFVERARSPLPDRSVLYV